MFGAKHHKSILLVRVGTDIHIQIMSGPIESVTKLVYLFLEINALDIQESDLAVIK